MTTRLNGVQWRLLATLACGPVAFLEELWFTGLRELCDERGCAAGDGRHRGCDAGLLSGSHAAVRGRACDGSGYRADRATSRRWTGSACMRVMSG